MTPSFCLSSAQVAPQAHHAPNLPLFILCPDSRLFNNLLSGTLPSEWGATAGNFPRLQVGSCSCCCCCAWGELLFGLAQLAPLQLLHVRMQTARLSCGRMSCAGASPPIDAGAAEQQPCRFGAGFVAGPGRHACSAGTVSIPLCRCWVPGSFAQIASPATGVSAAASCSRAVHAPPHFPVAPLCTLLSAGSCSRTGCRASCPAPGAPTAAGRRCDTFTWTTTP